MAQWKSLAGSTAEVNNSGGSWSCDFDWFEEGLEPGTLRDIRVEDGECWMFGGNDDENWQVQMFSPAVADEMIAARKHS